MPIPPILVAKNFSIHHPNHCNHLIEGIERADIVPSCRVPPYFDRHR